MSARAVGLLLWLMLGGLAAVALVWRISYPPQPPVVRSVEPAPRLPEVAPLKPFRLSPPDRYGEMTTRPLFIAERRPEPPPPDEASPPEKPPPGSEQKFILFGVMIAPGTQAALLRPEEPNARTGRIKLGEMIGEWRLDAVFPDRVVLRKGEATQELPLTRPRKPGKPRGKRGPQPGQSAAPTANAPVPTANAPVPTANVPIGPGGMPVIPQPDVSMPPDNPEPLQ